MRRLFAACVVVLSVGCAQPVPIHPFDSTSVRELDHLPEVVDEACAIVGLECAHSSHSYGAVTVDIVDATGSIHGRNFDKPCSPVVWFDEDPNILAHELGHVFELEDLHGEPENVMNQASQGDVLTDDQQDTVWFHADLFV